MEIINRAQRKDDNMRYYTLAILILVTVSCGSIETAADRLADSIDNAIETDDNDVQIDCLTANKGKDKGKKDEEDTDPDEACSSDEDTEEEVEEEVTDTAVPDDSDGSFEISTVEIPEDRYFIGTFQESWSYYQCEGFPAVTRLYSKNDIVYIENNKAELIAAADLFEDGTFDFDVNMVNQYGQPVYEMTCTCFYEEPSWYDPNWDCTCDYDSDSCNLYYVGF